MRCSSCGFENTDSAKFCSECGAPLVATAAVRREERKVVTAVFADLVGSTARAERLDPEDVRAILAPYHDRLRTELERHGGTVEKFIGDAVVGVFGAPVAHEDDPERGVRAALAIQEAIAELNEADPRLELEVRIGVHTGEALVTVGARPELGEAMVAGDVMNTAARLQAAAPAGGILVGEVTHQATDRAIEYEAAEAVTAKGKQAPVAVWLAVARRSGFGLDIGGVGRAPLVGRDRELDVLVNALQRAREAREPQLVTLAGVPGIGKSRLVYELYRTVEEDHELVRWRQGRSLPYGEGIAFWALGEIVKGQAGIHETDDELVVGEKLGLAVRDLLSDEAEASWVERHLRAVVGLSSESPGSGEGAADAASAWRRFVEALAESRPTVLVLEDLHWADDGLLDFVDELVDWVRDVPLLVVGTARPELLERRPGWGGGKRNAATLSLAPLTDEDTARLVGALLERSLLPAETQAELLAHAAGNPLYAEEFARMHAVGGGARVPDSLQAIVAARIDALPADEKSVLQIAAVLGKVFWTGALEALGTQSGDELEPRLRSLERKEFVRRERRSAMEGVQQYAFLHALIRDVAYGQLPRPERAGKHRLAAEWIEGLGRPDDHADLVAYHYGAALELATAAGLPTEPFEERARLAFKTAADRATRLTAFSSAIPLYRSALSLWPDDADGRAEVLFGLGRALVFIERLGEAELAEARELFERASDLEGAAEAERELSRLAWLQGDTALADSHIQTALELLEGAPPSRVKAEVLLGVSGRHMLSEDFVRTVEFGEQAMAIAEAVGDHDALIGAMLNVGAARIRVSGWDTGIGLMEQAVDRGRQARSWQRIRGLGILRDSTFEHGDLARAAELCVEGIEEAESAGHSEPLRWLTGEQAFDLYHAGAWDEASDRIEALVEANPEWWFVPTLYQLRSAMRLARGETAAAAEDAARSLALSREALDPQVLYPALVCCASTELAAGDRAAAARYADELLARWAARPGQEPRATWVVDLAFALLRLGRGREFVEALSPVAGYSRWVEASLALAEERPLEAAELFARIGSHPSEAMARLEAGRVLPVGEAAPQLESSAAFWRSVGATAYVNETEALRAEAS